MNLSKKKDDVIIPLWKRRVMVIEAIYSDLLFAYNYNSYQSRIIQKDNWTEFETDIFSHYIEKKSAIMEIIKSYLKDSWKIERLNLVLLAILAEAITEYHEKKTSKNILIQQSVLTTKNYCDEKDYKLVNAILDKYFKSLEEK